MMNSIDLQELRRRQMQLSMSLVEPLDMYKTRGLRLDAQAGLLPSSQGSSILGQALGLLSPQSLLPTMAPGQADLLALLSSRPQLLASRPQSSITSAVPSNMMLMAKLGQLGASLPQQPTNIPGRVEPFPEKLHRLLLEVEALGRPDIISFIEDDTFRIHDQETFFREIVPQYFRQTKLTSFKRQLKLYGFELISHGSNKGGYRHNMFSRKNPEKCRSMKRVAIKTPKSSLAAKEGKTPNETEETASVTSSNP